MAVRHTDPSPNTIHLCLNSFAPRDWLSCVDTCHLHTHSMLTLISMLPLSHLMVVLFDGVSCQNVVSRVGHVGMNVFTHVSMLVYMYM